MMLCCKLHRIDREENSRHWLNSSFFRIHFQFIGQASLNPTSPLYFSSIQRLLVAKRIFSWHTAFFVRKSTILSEMCTVCVCVLISFCLWFQYVSTCFNMFQYFLTCFFNIFQLCIVYQPYFG